LQLGSRLYGPDGTRP